MPGSEARDGSPSSTAGNVLRHDRTRRGPLAARRHEGARQPGRGTKERRFGCGRGCLAFWAVEAIRAKGPEKGM